MVDSKMLKDRKEAKAFIESLKDEDKQYSYVPYIERPKVNFTEGRVYHCFPQRLYRWFLSKYFPHKFNKFDL